MIPVYACVGAAENLNSLKKITSVPNPANGVFKLSFEESSPANYSVEIFNSLGQMIKFENITGSDHLISIENEQNGVYTVRVFQNNKIYSTNKLIKQ